MTDNSPIKIYEDRIKERILKPDLAQRVAIQSFERLFADLMAAKQEKPRNFFQRLTGLGQVGEAGIQGVYIHGGVGRGKSMLMDLFYETVPEGIRKSRVHFHKFMIDVHDYIHSRRESDGAREGIDATLPLLAERIAEKSRVLCFDEFHVTDVADAMILGRLFRHLFERDVIVVATSNWPPDRLYEGGLQRDRFLPFIELLKSRMEIVHLDSPTDYRKEFLTQDGVYFFPFGQVSKARYEAIFQKVTSHIPVSAHVIVVKGREIKVEAVGRVARVTFAQLCEQPRGAEDYLAIAAEFSTVFLEGLPKLRYDRRNEAKRLMTLIDTFYEQKVKLILYADASPDKIYSGYDHAFEFDRTISRLIEMQSAAYLAQ
jgi:cell division protein ZapE